MPNETRTEVNLDGVGERLRAWRDGRTQFELATQLGTFPQSISQYENGGTPRNWAFLAALAEAGCDINWLLTGRETE